MQPLGDKTSLQPSGDKTPSTTAFPSVVRTPTGQPSSKSVASTHTAIDQKASLVASTTFTGTSQSSHSRQVPKKTYGAVQQGITKPPLFKLGPRHP